MDHWGLIGYLLAGGLGGLAFLRIVANEMALHRRALELREKALQEEAKRQARWEAMAGREAAMTAAAETEIPTLSSASRPKSEELAALV